MVAFVEGRADQIVHRGINDDELLGAPLLGVLHLGDEDGAVAGDGASRLDDDAQAAPHAVLEQGNDRLGIGGEGRRLVALVKGRKAAADVQRVDDDAVCGEFVDQGARLRDGRDVRLGDLDGRADVQMQRAESGVTGLGGGAVDRRGTLDIDAELRFLFAGEGFGVRAALVCDIRIDAQGAARGHALESGEPVQVPELFLGFDVEPADAARGVARPGRHAVSGAGRNRLGVQGLVDLAVGLPDAGEDDVLRIGPGLQGANSSPPDVTSMPEPSSRRMRQRWMLPQDLTE